MGESGLTVNQVFVLRGFESLHLHVECPHDPQALAGKPIGQYHCPECGCMVLAGIPHIPHDDECEFDPKFDWDNASVA